MKTILILLILPITLFAQPNKDKDQTVVEGVVYPQAELPFKVKDHLVLTQSGICIGFFLANSDIVYGAKSGQPIGFIGADRYLYFSFPAQTQNK